MYPKAVLNVCRKGENVFNESEHVHSSVGTSIAVGCMHLLIGSSKGYAARVWQLAATYADCWTSARGHWRVCAPQDLG